MKKPKIVIVNNKKYEVVEDECATDRGEQPLTYLEPID